MIFFTKVLKNSNSLNLIKRIWFQIERDRKSEVIQLIFFMTFCGVSEIISLSAIVPFIGIITNPEKVLDYQFLNNFFQIFNLTDRENLINFVTTIFISSALVTGLVRLITIRKSTLISANIGSEISLKAFSITINQDYESYINQNSSQLIAAISSYTNSLLLLIQRLLDLLICAVVVVFLTIMIVFIAKQYIIIFGLSIFLIYFFILTKVKNRLSRCSIIFNDGTEKEIKILQETQGAMRDIYLSNTQKIYQEDFLKVDKKMRKAWSESQFLEMFPRYVIEASGMAGLALLSYSLIINNYSSQEILTLLGSIALCIQRVLPSCQSIYSGVATINTTSVAVDKILKILEKRIDLKLEINRDNKINEFKIFKLNNLSFKYKYSDKEILNNVNLTIKKGEKIGIIGETGSGKSTLVDIIMTLFKPSKGQIIINDSIYEKNYLPEDLKYWRNKISHVPQGIYLIDDTIGKNITFGFNSNDLDKSKLVEASKNACLDEFINSLNKKYETRVGENGIKLSGGQRQRIGIARALYRKSSLLILDEATSALDSKTEQKVMKKIIDQNPSLTIIMIAHRLSTLSCCDRIFEVDNGNVKELTKEKIKILLS